MSASAIARGARNAEYAAVFLALLMLPFGMLIGDLFFHTKYIEQTRTVTRSPYQHPAQSIPGTTVNAQLAGFTCDVYSSPQAVVCHR